MKPLFLLLTALGQAVFTLGSDKAKLLSTFKSSENRLFACPQSLSPLSLVSRYYGLLRDAYWVRSIGYSFGGR